MSADRDAWAARHWAWLLVVFCACVLWYYWGGRNFFAGIAGFLGLGWLAWTLVIKPRL
ncbi:MAG: hypothetical protein AAGB15_00360 [Pseudomonadota bacterium]